MGGLKTGVVEDDVMFKRYSLEIYPPGNPGLDVCCTFESDTPFLPIHKGDLIDPRTFNQHYASLVRTYTEDEFEEYGALLRVTGIIHFILQNDNMDFSMHKLGVFTEGVPNIEESRP